MKIQFIKATVLCLDWVSQKCKSNFREDNILDDVVNCLNMLEIKAVQELRNISLILLVFLKRNTENTKYMYSCNLLCLSSHGQQPVVYEGLNIIEYIHRRHRGV